ncbi:MAG: hypothetical protein ACP5O7_04635, partial [Phycisphaerae bacterium]
ALRIVLRLDIANKSPCRSAKKYGRTRSTARRHDARRFFTRPLDRADFIGTTGRLFWVQGLRLASL